MSNPNINPKTINDSISGGKNTNPAVEVINNLTLIDPAYFLDGNTVSQEDLFIFAELKARVKNKSFIFEEDDEEITISFIKNKDAELGNTSASFLTTNWTEVGNKEPELNRDLETFGIESIDIAVNAGLIPTVTINFVDIRGATLFEQGSCSPYAAFFYQPYPVFELTVKGYYGYPIKYYLAVKNFSTTFDASSGNYVSKGEFIGYTYAFLSDILLGYVMASAYMEGAKDKLKEIYKKYNDLYERRGYQNDPNSFNLDTMQKEPMTLFEYFTKIKELKSGKNSNQGALAQIGNSPEFAKLDEIGRLRNVLEDEMLVEIDSLKKKVEGNEQSNLNDNSTKIEFPETPEEYSDYFNDIFIKNMIDYKQFYNEIVGDFFNGDSNNLNFSRGIDDDLFKKTIINSIVTVNLKEFNDYRQKLIEEINKIEQQLQKDVSTITNQLIKKSIGFIPTIRSFFTVLIANTELFLELLKEASEDGENYHKENEDEIYFNGVKNDVKNVYYAWPTFSDKEENSTNGGSVFVERYPGIRFPNWPEVKFVEEFYLALETLKRNLDKDDEEEISFADYQDVPGRDNYMAINAMETPVGNLDTSNSYFNLTDLTSVYKTVGERFILTTNFTNLNQVNLNQSIVQETQKFLVGAHFSVNLTLGSLTEINTSTEKSKGYTANFFPVTNPIFPYDSFNLWYNPTKWDDPYLNGFYLDDKIIRSFYIKANDRLPVKTEASIDNPNAPENFLDNENPNTSIRYNRNIEALGRVDAHNLVDTFKENKSMLQTIVNNLSDPKKLKENILESLNIKDDDIDIDRRFTSYRYKPEEGIILNPKSREEFGGITKFYPSIYKMRGEDLFKIQRNQNGNPITRVAFSKDGEAKNIPNLFYDVVNGSASSIALNANDRDFGIEQMGKVDQTELLKQDVPVWAPTGFFDLTGQMGVDTQELNIDDSNRNTYSFNSSFGGFSTNQVYYKRPYFSNMMVNPWNGAFTTINFGNDLSKTNKQEEGDNIRLTKLSNFSSQSPYTLLSRPTLDIYPDYLFPYYTEGFKEIVSPTNVDNFNDVPYRYRNYGAIELTNFGMYNALPNPETSSTLWGGDVSTYIGKFGGTGGVIYPPSQNLILYSSPYKKPPNISKDDFETEEKVKTLTQLINLEVGEDIPTGDGVDFIEFGSPINLQDNIGSVFSSIDDQKKAYKILMDDGIMPKANINEISDLVAVAKSITICKSETYSTWGYFYDTVKSLKEPSSEVDKDQEYLDTLDVIQKQDLGLWNYMAGPLNPDRPIKWYVFANNGEIITTSKKVDFQTFLFDTFNGKNSNGNYTNTATQPNKYYNEWKRGVIGFVLVNTRIYPEISADGTTRSALNVFVPEELFDSNDFIRRTIKAGPIEGKLINQIGGSLGIKSVKNRLNTGNTIIESPFWRHNFPAPENNSNIGSIDGKSTVYYTYWGGKYYVTTQGDEIGKHLPIGVGVDLDSWDNTSELIKGDELGSDPDESGSGRKYIRTQHNKETFSLKKENSNKRWEPVTGHVDKSNYNRSKNWKGALAYLWLSNHFHRPWTGTYTNTGFFYGPQQTLGTASIVASIPKASLLLLGAVLWRMREAGLLISENEETGETTKWNLSPSENAIKYEDGKYIDPINVPLLTQSISTQSSFKRKYDGPAESMLFNVQTFEETNDTYTQTELQEKWETTNQGVKPPMACLYGFGSFYQNNNDEWNQVSGAMISCFPSADEWPTLNLGMSYAYDYFGVGDSNNLVRVGDQFKKRTFKNPFNNQYKIWTPVFWKNGALIQRFPNQSLAWITRKADLTDFQDAIEKAKDYYELYQSQDWEHNAQIQISKTTEKVVNDAKKSAQNATEQINILENFIKNEPKLGGIDESYTRLSILQHDLYSLIKRREKKISLTTDDINNGFEEYIANNFPDVDDATKAVLRKAYLNIYKEGVVSDAGFDYGRSLLRIEDKTSNNAGNPYIDSKQVYKRNDYLRGYIPIGPELWFLPTSVKEIIIKLFEDYVGDFNNFGGDANSINGSDFDKILAIIDPLNFPNPKGDGVTAEGGRKYPNVLKGDIAPYGLSSTGENSTYNIPKIETPQGATLGYPECLKRWEDLYTDNSGLIPRPPLYGLISQIPNKNHKEYRQPGYKEPEELGLNSYGQPFNNGEFWGGTIQWKNLFPTTLNLRDANNPKIVTIYGELLEEYAVANATPRIWWGEFANDGEKEIEEEYFYFNQGEIDRYLIGFSDVIASTKVGNLKADLIKGDLNSSGKNSQDNDIKLGLYRSLQAIYNKWISSSKKGNNEGKRLFYNPIGNGVDDDRLLIDHFSFVNRVNTDIGNKAVIDLETAITIQKNIQSSIFGVTSDILDKSNFLFHPLPGYVDISAGLTELSEKINERYPNLQNNTIANMFIPQTSDLAFENASGPHFLCMYAGGNSKALDLSRNKERNDCLRLNGIKEESEGDGGLLVDTVGKDNDGESVGVVGFRVKFGDQNQNHFISVNLDQAEYKNTNEALRAIDMISKANQPGAGGGFVFKGQSLYEVFLNRSYSCSVEAFGNMMIQPLQYFELENVPMFYGSYLIRDVKHTIKPHDVKTTFTGDRIPQTVVPVIEDIVVLYDIKRGEGSPTSFGGQSTSSSSSGPTGSYDLSNIAITTDNQKIIEYLKTSAVDSNGEPTGEEFKLTEYENVSLGKEGNWAAGQPSGIDLHWTAGYTTAGAYTTLKEKRLGYHIVLGEDGVAYNFSPLDQKASHGGCGTVYPNSNKSAGTCRSQNSKAIGISYVGGVESGRSALYDGKKSGVAYARTWEQWQEAEITVPFCPNGTKRGSSGLFVCADNKDYGEGLVGKGKTFQSKAQWNNLVNSILFTKSKYPDTIKYITTHYMHDSNKVDVGKDFPFDELITALKAGGWEDVKIITEWTAQDTGTIIKKDTLNQTLDEYVLTNAELQEYQGNDGQTTPGEVKEIIYDVSAKDRWTLVAICARENYLENGQGMADVAQAIINRLGSGKYKFTINDTNAIASIITDDKQFEPTFTSNTDQSSAQVWRDIKDWSSAIKAVQYKKGETNAFTEEKATEMLKTAYKAIYYELEEARSHVQGRTDFKASTQYTIINNDLSGPLEKGLSTEKNAEIVAGTRPPFVSRGGSKNNVFGFAYNYKDNITYTIKSIPCCPLEFIPPDNPVTFTDEYNF
jgi:N-acetyl-anhydromuramyl-L-alanine amidase AmpD